MIAQTEKNQLVILPASSQVVFSSHWPIKKQQKQRFYNARSRYILADKQITHKLGSQVREMYSQTVDSGTLTAASTLNP
jgi:hypothetical protein